MTVYEWVMAEDDEESIVVQSTLMLCWTVRRDWKRMWIEKSLGKSCCNYDADKFRLVTIQAWGDGVQMPSFASDWVDWDNRYRQLSNGWMAIFYCNISISAPSNISCYSWRRFAWTTITINLMFLGTNYLWSHLLEELTDTLYLQRNPHK